MENDETLHVQAPYVVAIGGGKGGVGKSVVALNLAVAMSHLGARVSLVDADLGSANLHTMLGIDRPVRTLQALVEGQVESLQELNVSTTIPGLSLIPGSAAVPGAANLQHTRKKKLLRHIAKLDADVVVIDCGAGVHYNVVDFFTSANLQLLVATPQLVSMQNAYGFMKACIYRTLQQAAQHAGKAQLFESSSERSELENLPRLFERLAVNEPELAQAMRALLAQQQVALIGNQLSDEREANALRALSRMFQDFLCLNVPVLGCLQRRDRIHASVTRRKPFVLDQHDAESTLLLDIAEAYLPMRPHKEGHERPFVKAASPSAVPLPSRLPHAPPAPRDTSGATPSTGVRNVRVLRVSPASPSQRAAAAGGDSLRPKQARPGV